MDRWDVLVILIAGYVAVVALVRLMARRRNQVLDHLREQISEQSRVKKNDSAESTKKDRGAA